jgi:hypothetical protein
MLYCRLCTSSHPFIHISLYMWAALASDVIIDYRIADLLLRR